jgi:hypothetical protein
MRLTRLLAGLAALFAITGATPVFAQYEGPWCAHMTLGFGFVENKCSMRSYAMCRAEITGVPGAWCTENPWYRPMATTPRGRNSVRYRYR